MSFLSQMGVIILIIFIIIVLIRANKTLDEVYEEGEHFVDEWDLRQQKKEARALERQNRKQEKKTELLKAGQGAEEESREACRRKEESDWEGESGIEQQEIWETKSGTETDDVTEMPHENIIPMNQYKNTGIILVESGDGNMPSKRISVNQIPFVIGRDRGCNLVLDDLCVARNHCRIVEENGLYILEDAGTKNKLFVNGLVTDRAMLSDGLRFFIGNVEFVVETGMSRSGSTRLNQRTRERYYE